VLELIITMAIILIIAAVGYPEFRRAFNEAQQQSTIVKGFQMSHDIRNAINVAGEPVAYWGFHEGAGTSTSDTSGNKNHGTIYGATWTGDTPHKVIKRGGGNWALQFDGVDDRVAVGTSTSLSASTDELTVEVWVKPLRDYGEEPSQWYYFVWWDAPSGYKMEFGYEGWGDQTAFKVFNTGGTGFQVDTEKYLKANQWYYFVGAINKVGNMVLYRNGRVMERATLTGTLRQGEDISIGARTTSGYFNGIIDEIKIYNRTFSIAAIRARYIAGILRRLLYE